MGSGRPERRRDERGVTTVMVAIMTGVLVVSAAFAVDLGLQRVLRRDLQAVVDSLTTAPVPPAERAEPTKSTGPTSTGPAESTP